MNIRPELVERLAALSQLSLSGEEMAAAAAELERAIAFLSVLDGLPGGEPAPADRLPPPCGSLREDSVVACVPALREGPIFIPCVVE